MIKWIKNLVKKSDQVTSRVVNIPITSAWYPILSGENITITKAMDYYNRLSSLATAVDMIGDEVANISPVLEQDGKITKDSEVIEKLRRPNGFETWQSFFESAAKNYLVCGNIWWYAIGAINNAPLELHNVKPQVVSGTVSNDGYPKIYRVGATSPGSGQYKAEETKDRIRYYSTLIKELWPVRSYNNAVGSIYGKSLINAIFQDVRQQILGRLHNVKLLENGGRLSLAAIFKDESPPSEDERRMRKEAINEQLSGAENAGKIATFFANELDIKEFGKSNKDMDYSKLDKIASQCIYLRFKIPLPLVSTDASTYNNFQQGVYNLYDRAVLPLADKLFSELSLFLLPRYGIDPSKVKITYDLESIQALLPRRIEYIAERKKIGIETTNELRQLMPHREDIEGGDVVYQPANLVPIGTSTDII